MNCYDCDKIVLRVDLTRLSVGVDMGKVDQSNHYDGDLFSGVGGLVISISHSKESLVLRLARIQSEMIAGQRDYERFLLNEQSIRKAASVKNYKTVIIGGETYDVSLSKHYIRWARDWSQQLSNYISEERKLVKEIEAMG